MLLAPRYLAGGGLSQARITATMDPLVRDFGWPVKRGHDTGRIAVTSPDRTFSITFDPTRDDGRWWTVQHHAGADDADSWQADITRHTPIEAVAAALQLLPLLNGDARRLERLGLLHEDPPHRLAQTRGWTADGLQRQRYASPEGRCTVHREPDDHLAWRIETSAPGETQAAWRADFTHATPAGLVTRFFANLSGPIPVERRCSEIPPALRDLPDVRIIRAAPRRPPLTARPAAQLSARPPAVRLRNTR
ncbi:DUF317 domain-containing protein [Streptomyces sp. NPDC088745]|uniref:DUF317 domain-containing protein n=1 Tax=Streptomyces sp. NPDC088745 TaxID=3365884 RepID=UPI003824525B